MKAFMVSQDCPFNVQLIQEIPYFQIWVEGCLKDGPEILVGRHAFVSFFCSFDRVAYYGI